MSTTVVAAPGWYVVCEDYAAGPFTTQARAERTMESIVLLDACWHEHRVEER